MKLIRNITALVVLQLCLLSVAFASPTARITSGTTTVALTRSFALATHGTGIFASLGAPASQRNGLLRFKIREGQIDTVNLRGELIHEGGIRFSNGTNLIEFYNFILDTTGSTPILFAFVRKNNSVVGRLPLFTIRFVDPILSRSYRYITLPNSPMILRGEAASILNDAFNTNIFNTHTEVGTADITARLTYSFSTRALKNPFNVSF